MRLSRRNGRYSTQIGIGADSNPTCAFDLSRGPLDCFSQQSSAQVSVSGGSLKLLAERTTIPYGRTRNGDQVLLLGLLILDGALFNRPAFWTDGSGDWPSTGEIDVMAVLSGRQSCRQYHYLDASGVHQEPGGFVNWDDPVGFHNFSCEW